MTTADATREEGRRMGARYHGTRFDLNEGRDWLITTPEAHEYIVTIWHEEALGRMASCRCKAFGYGLLCRHIRYAQSVDSILTGEPLRAIRPVFYERPEMEREAA